MKQRLSVLIFAATLSTVPVLAHGDNEHVRGTVTAVTAESIVINMAGAATPRTLTIDAKTVFLRGGKTAHAADVQIGDRVVIDVPKKTNRAEEVNFSRPTK